MPVHNVEIAELFNRLADLLEFEEANPFRVRAYRNAARTIGDLPQSVTDLIREGKPLTDLPGIGEDLAGKIETVVKTGRLPPLEEIEKRFPPALTELMKIEGLGPKRVKTLYKQLKIESLKDLERAARSGKISELKGFGPRTEELILRRLERFTRRTPARTRLADAEQIVKPLLEHLKAAPGIQDLVVAGSYRRRMETVGDIDILATARNAEPVMDRFTDYEEVVEVVSKGGTRSSVRLRSGLAVDLRVVPQASFGAAIYYFTGSKAHNIAVRRIAIKKGYKLNEYGIFRGERRVAGRTEEEVFEHLGLSYIPPELRENRGEVEAAQQGTLPALITLDDIRGDLHCHTNETDGKDTLQAMVQAARDRGYEYVAITDHSRHVAMARGLDPRRLRQQIKAIDRLNAKLGGFTILKSIELDILADGTLDLPDDVLKELDLTVCSVHYKFDLPRRKQTERILRAMDNPYFNILAHVTGRLINERDPYEVDIEKILDHAAKAGCVIEINAQPSRLDISDTYAKLAKELGVKIAISTDSHSTGSLDFMRFGIDVARRGWLEAKDVINTRPLNELKKLLRRA
jgi:DNA polymerase (family 10)